MKRTRGLLAGAMLGLTFTLGAHPALAQAPATKAGAPCGATSATAVPNNAVEPKSGRQFILQYPCDLKENEQVVLILNIHGAGSSANYQHRYFPAGDYAQKYRLVVATPTAAAAMPGRTWRAEADDQFLRDLTDLMFREFGKPNYVRVRKREKHGDPTTRWLDAWVYSDGAGNEILRKERAEPGPVLLLDAGGRIVRGPDGKPVTEADLGNVLARVRGAGAKNIQNVIIVR